MSGDLPLVGGDILVCPVVAEKVDDVEVVSLSGPVQRRPSVDVMLRVGVHAPEIFGSNKRAVLLHRLTQKIVRLGFKSGLCTCMNA